MKFLTRQDRNRGRFVYFLSFTHAPPAYISSVSPTHLCGTLDDEDNFLVRSPTVLEVGSLGHHAALRDVHEPQELNGAQIHALEDVVVNPGLLPSVRFTWELRG